jgi:hypothetical protein
MCKQVFILVLFAICIFLIGCANQGYVPLTSAVEVDKGLNKRVSQGKHLHSRTRQQPSGSLPSEKLQSEKPEKRVKPEKSGDDKLRQIKKTNKREKPADPNSAKLHFMKKDLKRDKPKQNDKKLQQMQRKPKQKIKKEGKKRSKMLRG